MDRNARDLFIASFIALFLELSLIRFLPANVVVVGYYTNLILIACFLGLGVGFLLSSSKLRLQWLLLPLVLVTVLTAYIFRDVMAQPPADAAESFWLLVYRLRPNATSLPIPVIVLIHFIVAMLPMVPVGQEMGRCFGELRRLRAYALDLGGSLAGVLIFGLLSALRTPPVLWFSIVAALALVSFYRTLVQRALSVVLAGGLVVAVMALSGPGEIWSPYYKVTHLVVERMYQLVLTNGSFHQAMVDFDADNPKIRLARRRFEIPYRLASSLDRVLIVGAGTGNDVAIALGMGARQIDAVEIDRVFPEIGRRAHRQRPYQDKRVSLHIGDARAYFKRCEARYDLIVFGTLDSQALLSGLSSVRLDNYVYTQESFEEAHRLLKPNGVLAVNHMATEEHIPAKIIRMLEKAGGRLPLIYRFRNHILFNSLLVQGAGLPPQRVSKQQRRFLSSVTVPTDDWPFLYLKAPSVPAHYGFVILGMLGIAVLATGLSLRGGFRRLDPVLFLLGAGFLLLETRSVTQLSLLFGSTWAVNLLIFASVLLMLLLSNLYVDHRKARGKQVDARRFAAGLVVCLVVLAFVQVSWISSLALPVQWVIGGLLVGIPVCLAGVVFPVLFVRAADPQIGFGSNLLGAIVGGSMEYASMLLGIRSMGLLAAVFYLLALALLLRRERAGAG